MGDYDRTRPIVDGRVQIDGVDPVCMLLSPEEMFFRAFRHEDFDISELSMASYCVTVARGDPHYIGGIAEYQQSANVWVRGILEQDYGVSPAEITWVRGGMDTPGRPEKLKLDLPADIRIEEAPEGGTLNQMLTDGDIDGFIGPRWPRCFDEGHPQVGRLFQYSIAAASDHYRRTGLFPIMHLVGVRRELAEQHAWLPVAPRTISVRSKS
jgi:4,5-dihydroxyphthalate decarboxylase